MNRTTPFQIHPTKSRSANISMVFTVFVVFVVVSILLVVCHTAYTQTQKRLLKIAIDESEQSLELSADSFSSSFHLIWESFTDSSLTSSLSQTLSESADGLQVSHGTLLTLSDSLRKRIPAYDYIQDVGLFISDGQQDYWCTRKIISDDFRRDYENGLYSFDDIPYESFRSMILGSADNRIVRQDFHVGHVTSRYAAPYSCHTLYLMYPLKTSQTSLKVFAVMQIDLDRVQEDLTASQYCGTHFSLYSNDLPVYISDPDAVLSSAELLSSQADGSKAPYYVKDFIDELGLTCYISLDTNKIYEGITPFSQLLLILFIIMAVMLLSLIIFFFYYWLIPITRVARTLPASSQRETPVSLIHRHLTELSSANSTIKNQLLQYQTNLAMKNLYLGKPLSSEDTQAVLGLLPAPEDNYRCVYIGCINDTAPLQIDSEYIIGQMKKLSMKTAASTIMENGIVCLVIQPDNQVYADSQSFFSLLNGLLDALNTQNPQFAIGVSDVYSDADNIPYAYRQAYESWYNALVWQNSAVVFSTALSQHSGNYSVSYSLLDSMYRAIITNSRDTALKFYDQMVDEHFERSRTDSLSALYYQQFLSDVFGVLVRISTEYDIHAIMESYLSSNRKTSYKKQIELLRKTILECCEFIPVHNYDKLLMNSILEYCEKHYNDYQLSLSALADQFHLSKSSLSKYFKANAGVTFSTYIEKLRLSHAKKMILEGKLSIVEIAEEVGYHNITTFYNVFRKTEKCTPTEWRQQHSVFQ